MLDDLWTGGEDPEYLGQPRRVPAGVVSQGSLFFARRENEWFPVTTSPGFETCFVGHSPEVRSTSTRVLASEFELSDLGRVTWIGTGVGSSSSPGALVWQGISSPALTQPSKTATQIGWRTVSGAATWEFDPDSAELHYIDERDLLRRIAAATRAAQGEQFTTGYESKFRRQLAEWFRSFGTPVIEALFECLAASSVDTDVLGQGLRFLGTVVDASSLDARLVFIARYLRAPSAEVRDAAANALEVLGDRRGASYLREAASHEDHVVLKYEFLEIAAQLETD